ncbi:hypothetical protein ACHAXS_008440 [Conticribra weissflogii]
MITTSLFQRGALIQRAFHSPDRLIVGNAPLVGVLDLPATYHHPPLRLFFPATTVPSSTPSWKKPKPATYFRDNRVAYVLEGMAHTMGVRNTTKMFKYIVRPILFVFSLFFPARFLRIPHSAQVPSDPIHYEKSRSVEYLPPSSFESTGSVPRENQSLVLFSHGLTGTGEENSIFCASLAKRGFVVACLHHCDGSSSRVTLPDGTCRFYEHMPSGDDYDPKHRMEQVHTRARELLRTRSWLLNGGNDSDSAGDFHPIMEQIRPHLDPKKVIASGFSYGSTTCALAATLEPNTFQCAVMLDGWFHVDYTSQGVEYDFPPEAFGEDWPKKPEKEARSQKHDTSFLKENNGRDDQCNKKSRLNIPCVFINSEQFYGYKKLYRATSRLADQLNNSLCDYAEKPRSELHVIANTKHQNFCDVVFWLPKLAMRRVGRFLALGSANGLEAQEQIINFTVEFLKNF